MNIQWRWALYAIAACPAVWTSVHAQGRAQVLADERRTDDDVAAAKVLLTRPVTVHLDRVPLANAVEMVSASAKIRLLYQRQLTESSSKVVTLHVSKQPLGAVLDAMLDGTGLEVVPLRGGQLALIERGSESDRRIAGGTVTGTIADATKKRPLAGAAVTLDDTTRRTVTDEHGVYRFVNVAAGAHRITVRFVGYGRETRSVTVADDQTTTLDLALSSSVNTLDQVVVTATGAQRYRELGHVVSQINADSLVREAPITSLSELLTARVPGLQVLTGNGGTVGGDVALRLRGQTTTSLDPQPIVIVDGVRYKSTSTRFIENGSIYEDSRPFNAEQRSPLNDLNVNDIETVEVVKGPSASTLYGPDAANGVIVITTKRGKVGKPQWHVYAYPDLAVVPKDRTPSKAYQAWGHYPGTTDIYGGNCTLQLAYFQNCVLDSITVVSNPVNNDKYSVITDNRPQWHSGLNVGGGTAGFQYFFSGNYDSQTGSLRIPPAAEEVLKEQLGVSSLSGEIRNPNTQQAGTLHTNISSHLSSMATVNFSGSYTQATQRAMDASIFFSQAYAGPSYAGVDTSYLGYQRAALANAFIKTTTEDVHRLTASLGGVVQPRSWITFTAAVGTDLDATTDRGIEPAGTVFYDLSGQASDYRRFTTGRSADLGLTTMAHPGRLSFRTSLGTQYTYNNQDGLSADGSGLAPGSSSITTATYKQVQQLWAEVASLGTYGEEVVGVNDRVFLTASMRLDGSTSFGDAYHPRPFPKVGASWIVSDEPFVQALHLPGLDELRVRYSFGAASRYPTSSMKLGVVGTSTPVIEGVNQNVFDRTLLANPLLRPERTRETEFGADATIARVNVGLTWYRRRTTDQLNYLQAAPGFLPSWGNVGNLAARGFEATLGTNVVDRSQLRLDLNATYSHNTNTVLSVGDASQYQYASGSLVVGYPLMSSFGQSILGVADTVGGHADGIILENEVMLSPVHFLGVLIPPTTYALTPTVSLFGSRIRLSSTFDRQTGGITFDNINGNCVNNGLCVAPFLSTTPPSVQALYVASTSGNSQFYVPSDFTRWRELSITGDLPSTFRERIGLSRASVSFQVRNLMLWTAFKGPDPESVPGLGVVGRNNSNGAVGIPQARAWTLRFDVSP